jgi:hypothetical protein
MPSKIKRGVSLYSYQDETFTRRLTLEDCIRITTGFGAPGIEVISEQSFANYPPALAEQTYAEWHALLAKYGAVPVAHDCFIDYRKYKGRVMSTGEQAEALRAEIVHAARLGCAFIRVLVSIAPEVMLACAGFAEQHNIKLLLEVHAPVHFDHPWILRHAEAYAKSGSQALGFLPDMGMFVNRFPRVWKQRFLRMGVPPHIADYIDQAYTDRVLSEYVINEVERLGGVGPSLGMATTLRHNAPFNPRRMLDHMDRIHSIHGKFYEMTEDLEEYSIPYDQIVDVLNQGGFSGYICSEYEGNRWIEDAEPVDSVEQVRRHQAMLSRLIDQPAAQ